MLFEDELIPPEEKEENQSYQPSKKN